MLACTPLSRLREISPSEDVSATKVATINENSQLIAEAYEKIETLPGYRLESRYVISGEGGHRLGYTLVGEYDATGNRHIFMQTANHQQVELFFVEGHTYLFESQYNGWIDLGPISPVELQQRDGFLPADFSLMQNPAQWLTRFSAAPTQANVERYRGRPATRYILQPMIAELSKAFDQEPSRLSVNLNGALWIDQETGALLKSEIILYDSETGQSIQEYRLEIGDIGDVAPIIPPTPVVDPEASVSATATAQGWSVLDGEMNYRGTPIRFELIPLKVIQIPDTSPLNAEVHIILRQLPEHIFQGANLEPFLAQLRQQLTLSIPKRNLIVTSSGFRLGQQTVEERSLQVIFAFNANLEDFNRVELILSGRGNPQFAPVPVE